MRGLLPSVWLLGAALYSVSVLFLTKPFTSEETWPAPSPTNETVVAKQPAQSIYRPLVTAFAGPRIEPVAFVTVSQPKLERPDEWVQIAGYTTMVRARPAASAPIVSAYAVGRPLRVLAREGGFVRVQDLGSGKLGWVVEASIAPFTDGYRKPDAVTPAPQVVASAAPQAPVPQLAAPQVAAPRVASIKPQAVIRTGKKSKPRKDETAAARAKQELVATAEPRPRGLFGLRGARAQRVALRGGDTGFSGIFGRRLGR
ncbi:MAG TPA: hypothetical protein VHK26_07025 [Methyloceanibacter sp.]|jgi:hypothetical protein|nr:hypothetical protein [Methyloceanibacter sp.]